MLRKIASTYHYRDKLPVSQIQELAGLSEKTVNTVISEGPKVGKTDYIKRVKPVTHAIMEFPITKEIIARRIGLSTNASNLTRSQFNKSRLKRWYDDNLTEFNGLDNGKN